MLLLKRLNCRGVECDTIIKEEDIVGISEQKHEPQNLYNENGDLVETKETESTFVVYFNGGREIKITKTTYDKLVATLKITTL